MDLSPRSRDTNDPESQRDRDRRRDRDRESGGQTPKGSASERTRERAAGKERQAAVEKWRERFGHTVSVLQVQTGSCKLSRLKLCNSPAFPAHTLSTQSHGFAEPRSACQLRQRDRWSVEDGSPI